MDPLGDPLTTGPIQAGWEYPIELYLRWQFRFIKDPDHRFVNGLVWTWTQTPSDSLELLLTLSTSSTLSYTPTFMLNGTVPGSLTVYSQVCSTASSTAAKYNSVWVVELLQSGRALSKLSETRPVVANSTPSVHAMHRVAFHPAIAVSLFLLTLSVSDFKQTLWKCGLLWPYVGMSSVGTRLHWDCDAMSDAAGISPPVHSTYTPNVILSVMIIHIIPSRQINLAIDDPLLVPSVTCYSTGSYLWNDSCAADDVSHWENLKCIGCRCFSHLYKYWPGIQVTRVCTYCGECQGSPVLNKRSIHIQKLDFEQSLWLPRESPIMHTLTPSRALLYPHPVVPAVPSTAALASCALTHQRYTFTF